ncbi:MAG: hypothetical protein WDZ28_00185 [Simkaniaceae bacterium]
MELLIQLRSGSSATLIIEEVLLEIKVDKSRRKAVISCCVFSGQGHFPVFIKDLLTSSQNLSWSDRGPYLKADQDSGILYLKNEIEFALKYVYLKSVVREFLIDAQNWQRFFHLHQAKASFLFS